MEDLANAAKEGFDALQNLCKSVGAEVDRTYSVIPSVQDSETLYSLKRDSFSEGLLPKEDRNKLTALRSGADGNCLYGTNTVSLYLHVFQ